MALLLVTLLATFVLAEGILRWLSPETSTAFYYSVPDEAMSRLLRRHGVDEFDLVHHHRVAFVQHLPAHGTAES
jgi:hypothetical protein